MRSRDAGGDAALERISERGSAASRRGYNVRRAAAEPCEIACRRIAAAVAETETQGDIVHEITKATRRIKKGGGQGELL